MKTIQSLSRIILLSILFTGLAANLHAQKKYKAFKHKCTRVTISDPGELYSTYEMSEEEVSKISSKLGEAFADDIIANSTEDSWPSKMMELDDRVSDEGQENIKKFKAYRVIDIDDRVILVIPEKCNHHMPEGYVGSRDFYMIMGQSGLKQ